GVVHGARLTPRALCSPGRIRPGGTVLITGAGRLARLIAGHLVREHGVQHLLLASRRGGAASGTSELVAQLSALGAQVTVSACDVSDRPQLQRLLAEVPAENPLTAVVHAAGVSDDGLLESLTPDRVDRVLAGKADGAWHLHELTNGIELSAFVMLSSAVGTFGRIGQSSQAAANAFLDGLAEHRRALGLAGTSIAWGAWELDGGLAALGQAELARFVREGIALLSAERGLALFDHALDLGDAHVVAAPFERAQLRIQAQMGELPALLSGLVAVPLRRVRDSVEARPLATRLAGVEDGERERIVLELVRAQIASVLGYAAADAVQVGRTFKQLGFDSLAGVELRNRLEGSTGLRLPATLIFDYPTPAAIVGTLLEEIALEQGPDRLLELELDKLERAFAAAPADDYGRARAVTRLQALLRKLSDADGIAPDVVSTEEALQSASANEIYDFIDKQLSSA
ncbi:MAG: beta-ketoacyl reductase, partial [Solirubrobacteraceae bacterium]